jgi:DNA-binding transcriptional ArsR family regulator
MSRKTVPGAGKNDSTTSQNPDSPSVSSTKSTGRFAYEGLDRVLHEKARLGILASLAATSHGVLFNDLKQLCALTDGNLSRHLGVLIEAELVEVWKGGSGSRPQTLYRLTNNGRRRFGDYISLLEKIVADAQAATLLSRSQSSVTGRWSTA